MFYYHAFDFESMISVIITTTGGKNGFNPFVN